MRKQWDIIRHDLKAVLEMDLRPFNEVARKGSVLNPLNGCADPMRLTFRQLKKRMDKARVRQPEIKMLRSWDLNAPEHLTEEEREELELRKIHGY